MTPEELKKLYDEQNKLCKELRETLESKGAESVESKAKVAKLEERLNQLEGKNQEHVAQIKKAEDKLTEQKEAFDELQKKMFRSPAGKAEKSLHFKAFEKFIMKGEKNCGVEEMKYLRTDDAAQAGVLAPPEFVLEIIKGITEISAMRTIARVRPTSRGTVELPKRTSLVSGGWVGEGGTQSESESSYGEEVITTKEMSAYAIISHKMLNDSAFNMESEINQDIIETFAQLEGTAFVSGSGLNRPEGFLANAVVKAAYRASGVADNIDADTIIDLTGDLKKGYNPVFTLNRTTLAKMRQLKDGSGRYIWAPGYGDAIPNTLLGYPYAIMPDMDDIGAGKFPIAFGDFKRAYNIIDGMALYMIRDEYSLSTTGKIKFVALKSVGGKVVLAEAIKVYKCSAS